MVALRDPVCCVCCRGEHSNVCACMYGHVPMWEFECVYAGASHTWVHYPRGLVPPPTWRGWVVHWRCASSFRPPEILYSRDSAGLKTHEKSKSNLPMDRSDQLSILNTVIISSFFTELLCQDHQTLIHPYFGIGQEV